MIIVDSGERFGFSVYLESDKVELSAVEQYHIEADLGEEEVWDPSNTYTIDNILGWSKKKTYGTIQHNIEPPEYHSYIISYLASSSEEAHQVYKDTVAWADQFNQHVADAKERFLETLPGPENLRELSKDYFGLL